MEKLSMLLITDDSLLNWNLEILEDLFGKYVDIIYLNVEDIKINTNLNCYDLVVALNNTVNEKLSLFSHKVDIIMKPTTSKVDYIKNNINSKNSYGDLYISFVTIVDIIIKANLFFLIDDLKLSNYVDNIYNFDESLEKLYDIAKTLKIRQSSIFSFMRRSLIEIDNDYNIITINNIVEKLLKTQSKDIINTNFNKWFPDIEIDKIMQKGVMLKDKMVSFEGNNYFLSVHMVENEEKEILGANVVIEALEDVEDIYKTLRNHMFKQGYIAKYTIDNIIGNSSATENLKTIIRSMALSNSSVLITGETGTGKEIVAQALHNLSSRKDKPFVAINCVALTESLLESELFGYEEGAFTGAKKGGKMGVFELANGGTVFLDEIGKMPISLQGKLLRVIQEREIMRVGGGKIISIDIRLIAATNKNIESLIKENIFISDLYYRINVLPIYIPPLRDRSDDINALIKYYTQANGYRFKLSKDASNKIHRYKWPGNVREVINCLEYFDNLRKEVIDEEDLPAYILDEHNIEKKYVLNYEDTETNILSNYDYDEVMINLCQILLESYENLERIGRGRIVKKMIENGFFITEQRIRKYFDFLRNREIIIVHSKGGGTQLTAEGKDIVKNWLFRLDKQPN